MSIFYLLTMLRTLAYHGLMPKHTLEICLMGFLAFFLGGTSKVTAQETTSASVAVEVDIKIDDLVDGDILCSSTDETKRCDSVYDVGTLGVYSETPAAVIQNTKLVNGKPVISSGKAYVRVSNINGPIRKGDFVTTSNIPGLGQLADKSGNV